MYNGTVNTQIPDGLLWARYQSALGVIDQNFRESPEEGWALKSQMVREISERPLIRVREASEGEGHDERHRRERQMFQRGDEVGTGRRAVIVRT